MVSKKVSLLTSRFRLSMLVLCLTAFALLLQSGALPVSHEQTVQAQIGTCVSTSVPATANPYLAGMPNGTDVGAGDTAPAQSPTLISGLAITPGNSLRFTPTGTATIGPCCSPTGPEGGLDLILFHDFGVQNGISDIVAPRNSLIGVFLGPDRPDLTAAPARLDFSSQLSRDYTSLSPALKQVFFIGDGFTSSGVAQKVVVPSGATRLFLAVMDGQQWNNNTGSFSVTVCDVSTAIDSGDFCLQDESNRKLIFRFNKNTGAYTFTDCMGFELSGVGQVIIKGTDIALQDQKPDRKVVVKVSQVSKRGTADVQFFPNGSVFTIADRDVFSPCACP